MEMEYMSNTSYDKNEAALVRESEADYVYEREYHEYNQADEQEKERNRVIPRNDDYVSQSQTQAFSKFQMVEIKTIKNNPVISADDFEFENTAPMCEVINTVEQKRRGPSNFSTSEKIPELCLMDETSQNTSNEPSQNTSNGTHLIRTSRCHHGFVGLEPSVSDIYKLGNN